LQVKVKYVKTMFGLKFQREVNCLNVNSIKK